MKYIHSNPSLPTKMANGKTTQTLSTQMQNGKITRKERKRKS